MTTRFVAAPHKDFLCAHEGSEGCTSTATVVRLQEGQRVTEEGHIVSDGEPWDGYAYCDFHCPLTREEIAVNEAQAKEV